MLWLDTILEIFLRHGDLAALERDVAEQLGRGRAFVPGACDGAERDACILVVVHPDTGLELRLPAEIVLVRDDGLGLSLDGGSAAVAATLRDFLEANAAATSSPSCTTEPPCPVAHDRAPLEELGPVADDRASLEELGPVAHDRASLEELGPVAHDRASLEELGLVAHDRASLEELGPVVHDRAPLEELGPVPLAGDARAEDRALTSAPESPRMAAAEPDDVESPTDAGARGSADDEPARPELLHERLRGLNAQEQHRLARGGTLPERVQLERMYGPAVWEALLQNGRITTPEVARIAKKGTLPRPLIELIGASAAWVAAPEVQRALLSNPRASATVITKVLRAMSRSDLQKVPQQTAYPQSVRLAAKKILG